MPRWRGLAAWSRWHSVIGLLIAACGGGGGVSEPVTLAPEQLAADEPRKARAGRSGAAARTEVNGELQRVAVQVAARRELAVLDHIGSRALPRASLAERVRAQIARDVPPAWIDGQTRFLRLLGLVPPDFDYLGAFVGLLEQQLAGFYDPVERMMFIATDLPRLGHQETVVHELVHALQDQHFGLGELLRARLSASDALSAIHVLAEGDAMSVTLEAQFAEQGVSLDQLDERALVERLRRSLDALHPDVPGIVRRAAVAPYADGLVFVQALRREGGWARVNQAWRRPPRSTEQVLHPRKYAEDEGWRSFPALGRGPWSSCRLAHDEMLGEQAVALLLAEWVPVAVARAAASGWDGDRASVFVCGTEEAVVWRLGYDERAERAAALKTMRRIWSACSPDTRLATQVRPIDDALVVVALRGPGASCEALNAWLEAVADGAT